MRVYNSSEARKRLADVLNIARTEEVVIKRRDGESLSIFLRSISIDNLYIQKNMIRIKVDSHRGYLNTNILMTMAMTADQQLATNSAMPFSKHTYADDPEQLTADDVIGEAIAKMINGARGAQEYGVLKQLIAQKAPFKKHRPMMKQMLIGLVSGVVSIVNPEQNIIRVTQKIDYGRTDGANEKAVYYVPEGTTQKELLKTTAVVSFRDSKHHGRVIDGINGVKSNPEELSQNKMYKYHPKYIVS
ncbi:MAG: hypothetical protein SWH68_15325 [Thermodesulfobacteriota bacterium]|nr:hypothetical protein [Thermodesulfobacteriota bacterium]